MAGAAIPSDWSISSPESSLVFFSLVFARPQLPRAWNRPPLGMLISVNKVKDLSLFIDSGEES